MRIFPVSLDKLCKSMNVDGKLSIYNSKFNSFDLFNDNSLLNKFIKYSIQDSIALLEAMLKAQELYFLNYKVDIASIWSTSTLSLKIFRNQFLKETIKSLTTTQDKFIRQAYFGGATDHYVAHGQNLKYYDVNSLYPFVMLKDMPLEFIKFHSRLININLNTFFGFCLVEVECPKDIRIPLLPYRNVNGDVSYPTGKWQGVYFSELLKAVIPHGYKIRILEGHEYSRGVLFTDYVNHFYDIKKTSTGATRFLAKMQLNQLYVYFGRTQDLIITTNAN